MPSPSSSSESDSTRYRGGGALKDKTGSFILAVVVGVELEVVGSETQLNTLSDGTRSIRKLSWY